ncbi:hypothetical protein CYMTET_31642, partial [Cymbomonas tetramitiformis]
MPAGNPVATRNVAGCRAMVRHLVPQLQLLDNAKLSKTCYGGVAATNPPQPDSAVPALLPLPDVVEEMQTLVSVSQTAPAPGFGARTDHHEAPSADLGPQSSTFLAAALPLGAEESLSDNVPGGAESAWWSQVKAAHKEYAQSASGSPPHSGSQHSRNDWNVHADSGPLRGDSRGPSAYGERHAGNGGSHTSSAAENAHTERNTRRSGVRGGSQVCAGEVDAAPPVPASSDGFVFHPRGMETRGEDSNTPSFRMQPAVRQEADQMSAPVLPPASGSRRLSQGDAMCSSATFAPSPTEWVEHQATRNDAVQSPTSSMESATSASAAATAAIANADFSPARWAEVRTPQRVQGVGKQLQRKEPSPTPTSKPNLKRQSDAVAEDLTPADGGASPPQRLSSRRRSLGSASVKGMARGAQKRSGDPPPTGASMSVEPHARAEKARTSSRAGGGVRASGEQGVGERPIGASGAVSHSSAQPHQGTRASKRRLSSSSAAAPMGAPRVAGAAEGSAVGRAVAAGKDEGCK